MKKITLLTLFSLVIISCKRNKTLHIDNPTNETLSFVIDNRDVTVSPLGTIDYKTLSGDHVLKSNGKETSFYLPKDGKFLFNPTQSTYILQEAMYGEESWDYNIDNDKINSSRKNINKTLRKSEKDQLFLVDTIQIRGVDLVGFYKETSEIIIKDIWDYEVYEPFPETIRQEVSQFYDSTKDIPSMGKFKILTTKGQVKIFREKDFLEYLLSL